MRTLGILWIVYGIGRLAGAAAVFVWNTTLTLMFGALLVRVPNPYTLMSLFHIFLVVLIALGIIAGVVSLLAGFALMTGTDSAKPLSLVAAFFAIINGPLGIALGAFTLYFFSKSRPNSSVVR
jgi:ethanolamine transporter EutH